MWFILSITLLTPLALDISPTKPTLSEGGFLSHSHHLTIPHELPQKKAPSPKKNDPIPPRSPIPQPGENITRPLPYHRFTQPQNDPQQNTPIPWNLAHRHLGQTVTIQGTIVNTHRLKQVTFLNFHKNWHDTFYIAVFTEAHHKDFHPEKIYLNKILRITGEIKLHRNRPQIQVRNLSQIQIINP